MATLEANLTRMRRFLRDVDGTVWTDDDILQAWNDAQLEVSQKANILEHVESHYYPPEFNWSYQWDWEFQYTEGDYYKCLNVYQQTGQVICYPWESIYWGDLSETPDDGIRFTHPWEGAAISNPADVVPIRMHTKFQTMKYAAFDEYPIDNIQIRNVAESDPHWKTRIGQPTSYYFLDETENLFCLYPHPFDVTWQETTEDLVFADDGGLQFDFGTLAESSVGISTDVIDTDNAIFMVYDAIPYAVAEWDSDECDIPDIMRKYVEYATLERCFGMDCDGFIPTLRDYWKMRKEAGIQAINRMLRMRVKDRDYQLGGTRPAGRLRGGSLGPHYPSV
jgi:hypothetical protein